MKFSSTYNKDTARRFMKMEYYEALFRYAKLYEHIEAEKRRLSTPRWDRVSHIFNQYKEMGDNGEKSSAGKALKGLYLKNLRALKISILKELLKNYGTITY